MRRSANGFHLTFLFALVYPIVAVAQDCNAILAAGIRDLTRATSTDVARVQTYFNHCYKDYSTADESLVASAEAEVFGSWGGSGGLDIINRRKRMVDWCQTSRSFAERNQAMLSEASQINGPALNAWNRCQEIASNAEVVIEPEITVDNRTVSFSIRYTGGAVNGGPQLLAIDTEGFVCALRVPQSNGPPQSLPSLPRPITLMRNVAVTGRCTRSIPTQRARDGTTYDVLPRGTIVFQTTAKNLQLYFPEIWDPGLPAQQASRFRQQIEELEKQAVLNDLPIGTVVPSLLSSAEFAEATGDSDLDNPRWVLADGSSVTGTTYARVTGRPSVPDLRGVFLRGLNLGRDDGLADPDNSRQIGSLQSDALQEHNHPETGSSVVDMRYMGESAGNMITRPSGTTTGPANGRTAPETRPKNGAVNYFIKVR